MSKDMSGAAVNGALAVPRLTMTAEDLAALLGKTPEAINRQRHEIRERRLPPEALPVALDIPGNRRVIWLVEDVIDWLRRHREAAPTAAPLGHVRPDTAPRRRGRPTKREQATRLASVGGAL
jgi:hypothetical protein